MNLDFMREALSIAKSSEADVPVGAVIVRDGKIIAVACNEKEKLQQVYRHAEVVAIEKASKRLKQWRLDDCSLYVTLEPCPMCAWAILQSRIKNVYFGSYDSLYGAFGSKLDLREYFPSKISVYGGILEEDCSKLLKEFFEKIRDDNKK